MTDTPPFDPPYFTILRIDEGIRVIETLPDNTTREVPPETLQPRHPRVQKQGTPMPKQMSPVAPPGMPDQHLRLPPGDRRAAMYLDVPFAEKDEAKGLGARWDGDMRKWYVPHGTDINLFTRWWPAPLKQATQAFGQL